MSSSLEPEDPLEDHHSDGSIEDEPQQPTTSEDGKTKRIITRKRLTPDQLLRLEHAFIENRYPSRGEMSIFADRIGTTFERVRNWFINTRNKMKRTNPPLIASSITFCPNSSVSNDAAAAGTPSATNNTQTEGGISAPLPIHRNENANEHVPLQEDQSFKRLPSMQAERVRWHQHGSNINMPMTTSTASSGNPMMQAAQSNTIGLTTNRPNELPYSASAVPHTSLHNTINYGTAIPVSSAMTTTHNTQPRGTSIGHDLGQSRSMSQLFQQRYFSNGPVPNTALADAQETFPAQETTPTSYLQPNVVSVPMTDPRTRCKKFINVTDEQLLRPTEMHGSAMQSQLTSSTASVPSINNSVDLRTFTLNRPTDNVIVILNEDALRPAHAIKQPNSIVKPSALKDSHCVQQRQHCSTQPIGSLSSSIYQKTESKKNQGEVPRAILNSTNDDSNRTNTIDDAFTVENHNHYNSSVHDNVLTSEHASKTKQGLKTEDVGGG